MRPGAASPGSMVPPDVDDPTAISPPPSGGRSSLTCNGSSPLFFTNSATDAVCVGRTLPKSNVMLVSHVAPAASSLGSASHHCTSGCGGGTTLNASSMDASGLLESFDFTC